MFFILLMLRINFKFIDEIYFLFNEMKEMMKKERKTTNKRQFKNKK